MLTVKELLFVLKNKNGLKINLFCLSEAFLNDNKTIVLMKVTKRGGKLQKTNKLTLWQHFTVRLPLPRSLYVDVNVDSCQI